MSTQQATLTHLADLGFDEWELRYTSKDATLWHRIKDEIMDAHKDERRWDPDACNGRGAWVISGYVLYALRPYFSNIDAWIAKSTAGNTPTNSKSTRNIEECPF